MELLLNFWFLKDFPVLLAKLLQFCSFDEVIVTSFRVSHFVMEKGPMMGFENFLSDISV